MTRMVYRDYARERAARKFRNVELADYVPLHNGNDYKKGCVHCGTLERMATRPYCGECQQAMFDFGVYLVGYTKHFADWVTVRRKIINEQTERS